MIRNATYKLNITRRQSLYVHDETDHALMLVEMEGEPLHYEVGVAGEFVSRRSVNFHDRIAGTGHLPGYAVTVKIRSPPGPGELTREPANWPALRERVRSRLPQEKNPKSLY